MWLGCKLNVIPNPLGRYWQRKGMVLSFSRRQRPPPHIPRASDWIGHLLSYSRAMLSGKVLWLRWCFTYICLPHLSRMIIFISQFGGPIDWASLEGESSSGNVKRLVFPPLPHMKTHDHEEQAEQRIEPLLIQFLPSACLIQSMSLAYSLRITSSDFTSHSSNQMKWHVPRRLPHGNLPDWLLINLTCTQVLQFPQCRVAQFTIRGSCCSPALEKLSAVAILLHDCCWCLQQRDWAEKYDH